MGRAGKGERLAEHSEPDSGVGARRWTGRWRSPCRRPVWLILRQNLFSLNQGLFFPTEPSNNGLFLGAPRLLESVIGLGSRRGLAKLMLDLIWLHGENLRSLPLTGTRKRWFSKRSCPVGPIKGRGDDLFRRI